MEAERELLFERWSVALDATNVGVWDWRITTDETVYDDRWYEMAGYAPGAFPAVYQEWRQRVHDEDIGPVEAILRAHLAGELPAFEVEFRFRRADESWMWIAATGRIMERDAAGAPSRMVGIHQDVTHQRAIKEQLQHSQRMEAVGHLAGGIAHDFNNMLGGILGYAELLVAKLEPGTEASDFAGHICRAAENAGALTANLLAFSRRGHRAVEIFDLAGAVEAVEELLSRTLPHNIGLDIRNEAPGSSIEGDPVQMQSSILNLAVNARDAMPDGGRISIRLSPRELDARTAAGYELAAGTYLQVSVADTGVGIAPDILEHIFDPYFTTKEFGKGTGLGLAAVYGTAREHGGHVIVESTVGQGSVFSLLLPTVQGLPERAEAERAGAEGVHTVLVADDEELVRMATVCMLRRAGHVTLEAASGEECLEIYRERGHEIDLVILDVAMPGIGGAGAFRAIRELDPEARVVLATGFVEDAGALDETFPGRAGMLAKPFRRAELLGALDSALAPEDSS